MKTEIMTPQHEIDAVGEQWILKGVTYIWRDGDWGFAWYAPNGMPFCTVLGEVLSTTLVQYDRRIA